MNPDDVLTAVHARLARELAPPQGRYRPLYVGNAVAGWVDDARADRLARYTDTFDARSERIDPGKDVDGFHPYNIGRLVLKRPALRPCTPYGCMTLLHDTGEDLVGKHAVVIGQSNIVGRPMALELLMARCTVTICHSKTRDLPGMVGQGDIVVAGIGRANFVQGGWLKPGAIVIDVGINRNAEGKLCGDVDFGAAKEVASWITPVPGGVGPMTIATLLANTLRAAELQDAATPDTD